MAYGRFKSMGSLGLFQCIWQLVDHLPFAYVEKQSLSYGRKEVPFATWCFLIKANSRLSTICQTSVIVLIFLSTMCHKSKICNLPYAIYHPSLSPMSPLVSNAVKRKVIESRSRNFMFLKSLNNLGDFSGDKLEFNDLSFAHWMWGYCDKSMLICLHGHLI